MRRSARFALGLLLPMAVVSACSTFTSTGGSGSSGDVDSGTASDANTRGDSEIADEGATTSDADTDAGTRTAFVTKSTYTPGVSAFTGITEADKLCAAEASASPLKGRTFLAWMSVAGEPAYAYGSGPSRFKSDTRPIYATDGSRVALNWDAFVGGSIEAPIAFDADGTSQMSASSVLVWTGTNAQGGLVSGYTCADWSGADASSLKAAVGNLTHVDATWSLFNMTFGCNGSAHIYCISM